MSWDDFLPLLTLLTSLVPAGIIFLLREAANRTRTVVNLAGATLKLALIGVMLWGVFQGYEHEFRFPVLPANDLVLRADSLAIFFVTLSGLLWFLTTIYAIAYLEGSPHRRRFFGFFSLCVSATVGIALAGNLFTFVIFYELLTLSTYPLVVHRETDAARRAGRVYLAYTLGGGALLLFGAVWLHTYIPSVSFDGGEGLASVDERHHGALQMIFCLLIAGLGVKAALVPLHGWLPEAMIAPAPVSALLHAVAVVKAGAFGIMRVVYDIFGIDLAKDLGLTFPLGILASVTILYGSVRALAQDDLKRRLAFSTVSQVSYVVLGVAIGGPSSTVGGVAHLVHQGLMKVTLFFCAGNLNETLGIHKVSEMRGVGQRMPWTMTAFTVAALGMIGVPPMAGFITKCNLGAGAIEASQFWVLLVLAVSSLLNASYFLPILRTTWFAKARGPGLDRSETPAEPFGGASSVTWPAKRVARLPRMEAVWGLLAPPLATAVFALVAGLFAGAPISPLQWSALVVDRAYDRVIRPPGGLETAVVMTVGGALLLAAILTPLIVACCLPWRRHRRVVLSLASFAALPAVVLAIWGDVGTTLDMPWVLLHMHIGLDATGQTFLLFTSLLWLFAGIYARGYLGDDSRSHHFFGWFLLAMAGNFGLVVSLDMVSFYFCFALMSFSAYGLIVHHQDRGAFRAGRVYIVLVVLGEVALFTGMVFAVMARGSLLFDVGTEAFVADPTRHVTFGLLLLGLGIKAGIVPLHVWLPLAHPAAPTPASAVLSGTMIKAGVLGWLRFLPVGESVFLGWGELCLILGSVTTIYAAVVGVTQSNAKAVLAYSSISQMGLITVGLGAGLLFPLAWPGIFSAIVIYALHHSLSKGCLFLSVGVAQDAAGVSWRSRLVQIGLVIPALAMAGAPLTIGAVAKTGLKESLATLPGEFKLALGVLLPIVSIGTTLLMVRFLQLVWPRPDGGAASPSRSARLGWSALLLLVVSAAWLVPGVTGWGGGVRLLAETGSWTNLWPMCLGVVLAWGGWQLLRFRRTTSLPSIPAGDLLILGLRAARSATVGLRLMKVAVSRIQVSLSPHPDLWVDAARWRMFLQTTEGSLARRPWIGVALLILIAASLFLRGA